MLPFSSATATGRGQLLGIQALEQGQGDMEEAFPRDPIPCTPPEGPWPAVKVRMACWLCTPGCVASCRLMALSELRLSRCPIESKG